MKLKKIKRFNLDEKKKRVLAVAACVGLIGLSVYLNVALGAKGGEELASPAPSPHIEESSIEEQGDYFQVFKSERDDVREKELYALETIVNDVDADEAMVKDASTQRLALIAAMETETNIEGLLLAKGFSAAAVTVSANSVNVVIEASELNDAKVAQILDIAGSESGQPVENIKVIPLN